MYLPLLRLRQTGNDSTSKSLHLELERRLVSSIHWIAERRFSRKLSFRIAVFSGVAELGADLGAHQAAHHPYHHLYGPIVV